MCNFYGVRVSRTEFIRLKEIERDLRLYNLSRPYIDGFDYGEVDIIKPNKGGDWDIVKMEWGFVPNNIRNRASVEKMRFGYKDASGRFNPALSTLNAKGEELLQIDPVTGREKMYRQAGLHRRCLFLSTGFFEWRHMLAIGKKGQPLKQTVKYPYHVGLKEQELFYIAGIWQSWTDKDSGETVDTCAMITTNANELMAQVHNSKNRMPVILPEHLAAEWISDGLSEQRITEIATYKISAGTMKAYTIPKDFKTALNPTEPFRYDELPEINLNEILSIPVVKETKTAASVQANLFS
jgi:putative SOS response-associated peptidase YedK